MWKSSTVVPLPKTHHPTSIEKDIIPIFLIFIVMNICEVMALKGVDETIKDKIDPNQYNGAACLWWC